MQVPGIRMNWVSTLREAGAEPAAPVRSHDLIDTRNLWQKMCVDSMDSCSFPEFHYVMRLCDAVEASAQHSESCVLEG